MKSADEIARAIGAHVREGRHRHAMTLESLGQATDLSIAFLSRLERGETSTSIGNLIRIAGVIGLSLQQIFEADGASESPRYTLSKRRFRQSQGTLAGPGYAYERIQGRLPGQLLEAFELEYPVGAMQEYPPLTHEGEEILYLLSGKIEFEIGARKIEMAEGDCVHLQSSQPHRGWNIGNHPARMLMVVASTGGPARTQEDSGDRLASGRVTATRKKRPSRRSPRTEASRPAPRKGRRAGK